MRHKQNTHQRQGACFNPRIRKGCDQASKTSHCSPASFNPRIRKGCDYGFKQLFKDSKVSIHASVKDATLSFAKYPIKRLVSIHASVKDATKEVYIKTRCYCVSIHASVKDATCQTSHYDGSPSCFNPRIRKGCDKH